MTDQDMFRGWAQLLAPLFPEGAEFGFKPRRRLICVSWVQNDQLGRTHGELHTITIAFTQLAWKAYRGARSARRARADINLIALTRPWLEQHGDEESSSESRIQVASIDLFPPLPGAQRHAESRQPGL